MHILKKYLRENGIQQKWFCKNVLGIEDNFLTNILNHRSKLPLLYWDKVVVFTKGQITYKDLLNEGTQYDEKRKAKSSKRST